MSKRGVRGAERWDETDEFDFTLKNGERAFGCVPVEWRSVPIEAVSESQLWWLITIEDLRDAEALTWSEELFGQTVLFVAQGWQWADKAFERPKPYWRLV